MIGISNSSNASVAFPQVNDFNRAVVTG